MCNSWATGAPTPPPTCASGFTKATQRGGNTGHIKTAGAVAFYEESKGIRLFLDPQPSVSSPVAELVQNYPIKSKTAICHIR